ncbi:PGF-CTERM sorting domain-containing protein [Halosolutus gelatinilyticus]|uniref:PGF-CTERM sorting domain-containing protein n=1 Tax=Halosolutus gelatinilyticus TaxID=2931975 RepID=UPI001FF54FE1|nr:PGF-CTERM sorting domain-containing protein [Halosolutus gelatinilyticus]
MVGSITATDGSDRRASVAGLALVVVAGLVIGALAGPSIAAGTAASPSASGAIAQGNVSEAAYDEPVPTEGDPYFEEAADDGSWVSYVNPRDEYRDPYLGEGSGKICVTLLNEAGEPIVGESVPNTSVTIETGESLAWHSQADPFVVDFPLTEHYVRPFDGDQFGTSSDYPQGDGILDAHCLEWHGLPENETVEFGEAQVEGEHADKINVVGYIKQLPGGDGWDTDVDPIADAEPYDATEGGWTYEPNDSHGQTVVVLQLEGGEGAGESQSDDGGGGLLDPAGGIGFGTAAAVVALAIGTMAWYRQYRV